MTTLRQTVTWQLGRPPAIDFTVAGKCAYGWPAVLKCAPVSRDGSPNPNLYYLSCPYLRRRLSVLEDEGLIRILQEQLKASDDLRASLIAAQDTHLGEWARLAEAPAPRARSAFIAGVGDPLVLKCLHAHYAWYLVHPDYPLGAMIAARIGDEWCPDELCRASLAAEERSGPAG